MSCKWASTTPTSTSPAPPFHTLPPPPLHSTDEWGESCAAHLADVVCTWSGDRLAGQLLAADAHERLLHTLQKARLWARSGSGKKTPHSTCCSQCWQYLAVFPLLRVENALPQFYIEGVGCNAGSLLLAQVELGSRLLGWAGLGAAWEGGLEGGEKRREGG